MTIACTRYGLSSGALLAWYPDALRWAAASCCPAPDLRLLEETGLQSCAPEPRWWSERRVVQKAGHSAAGPSCCHTPAEHRQTTQQGLTSRPHSTEGRRLIPAQVYGWPFGLSRKLGMALRPFYQRRDAMVTSILASIHGVVHPIVNFLFCGKRANHAAAQGP